MSRPAYPRGLIKVCGLRSAADARLAASLGADLLGVIHGVTHQSEDARSLEQAHALLDGLGDVRGRAVLVTHRGAADWLAETATALGLRHIQLHGEIAASAVAELRSRLPEVGLIKAVHVTGAEALEEAARWAGLADALLLDSRSADRLGGTGAVHDWRISRRIAADSALPVLLAGGLAGDNVAAAIQGVGPAGVDANSRLRAADGAKDRDALRRYIAAARAAFAAAAGPATPP